MAPILRAATGLVAALLTGSAQAVVQTQTWGLFKKKEVTESSPVEIRPEDTKVIQMISQDYKKDYKRKQKNLLELFKKDVSHSMKKYHKAASSQVSHFTPDNGMVCIEGPYDVLDFSLVKLRVGPLGRMYKNGTSLLKTGPCKTSGYTNGPFLNTCWPDKVTTHIDDNQEHHNLILLGEQQAFADWVDSLELLQADVFKVASTLVCGRDPREPVVEAQHKPLSFPGLPQGTLEQHPEEDEDAWNSRLFGVTR